MVAEIISTMLAIILIPFVYVNRKLKFLIKEVRHPGYGVNVFFGLLALVIMFCFLLIKFLMFLL